MRQAAQRRAVAGLMVATATMVASHAAWAAQVLASESKHTDLCAQTLAMPATSSDDAIDVIDIGRVIADRSHPDRRRALRLARLIGALERLDVKGGDGTRTHCLGLQEHERPIEWLFDLEQVERVEMLNGETLLTALESRHTLITSSLDDRRIDETLAAVVIELPPRSAWRVGSDRESIEATRRFRRVGSRSSNCLASTGCSQRLDVSIRARAVGQRIHLEQSRYVNGSLSEHVHWQLDPAR